MRIIKIVHDTFTWTESLAPVSVLPFVRLSVCLSVCLCLSVRVCVCECSLHVHIFWSYTRKKRRSFPKHLWIREIQIFSNKGPYLFPRRYMYNIFWQFSKIFFSRTTNSFQTKHVSKRLNRQSFFKKNGGEAISFFLLTNMRVKSRVFITRKYFSGEQYDPYASCLPWNLLKLACASA